MEAVVVTEAGTGWLMHAARESTASMKTGQEYFKCIAGYRFAK